MKFTEMDLSDDLVKSLAKHDITDPSEIQVRSIPAIQNGHDLLAESETGSGKTLAFAIPMLERLNHKSGQVQAIILCPTRELAKQVAGEFEKFGTYTGLNFLTVYGGVGYEPQIDALPETDIVIGTPGRVLDLMERGNLRIDAVEYLVLDEADRMLDMGFVEDIEQVIDATPPERQTLLFSATIDYRIEVISRDYMHDPVLIRAKSDEVRGHLFQGYYVVNPWQKISLLHHLIKQQPESPVLIFCRTIVATDHVASELRKRNLKAESLNGDMSQARRESTVKEFQNHTFNILVATDVAARGLHIDGITQVYNYDLPDEADTYVHRVGRTARQGADGEAIVLLCEDDYRKFDGIMDIYDDEIEKLTFKNWGILERIPPSPPRDHGSRGGPRGNRGGPRGGSRGPPRGHSSDGSRGGSRGSSKGGHGGPRRK